MSKLRRRIIIGGASGGSYLINVDDYLTIEALEDGLTASLSVNACEYCVDGDGNWKTLAAGTATESINGGQILSFRGNLTPSSMYSGIGTFTITKQCNLKGNCMSMLFGDDGKDAYNLYYDIGNTYASGNFSNLFYNCTTIKSVSENFLPALTLSPYCYQNMFEGCTGLEYAPNLPALTLTSFCYSRMFYNCASLKVSPSLQATKLAYRCYDRMLYNTNLLPDCTNIDFTKADGTLCGLFAGTPITDNILSNLLPQNENGHYCLPAEICSGSGYERMFQDCKKLITPPDIFATEIGNQGCYHMFAGCTSLTTAPKLPAIKVGRNGYNSMFYGCTSLTTAPELPATMLENNCYSGMFSSCTALVTPPAILPATELYNQCYSSMFSYCDSLTIAPELPATTLVYQCYSWMFNGCRSLKTAPELPATTLASKCYEYMFRFCSKLNYIKMLATDISATLCLTNWVDSVASTGTFVKNPEATWDVVGNSGVPEGWTVKFDGEEEYGEEITFYFDTHPFDNYYILTAREGMTWLDWAASEYNTIGIEIEGEYAVNFNSLCVVNSNGEMIRGDDLIINEYTYML